MSLNRITHIMKRAAITTPLALMIAATRVGAQLMESSSTGSAEFNSSTGAGEGMDEAAMISLGSFGGALLLFAAVTCYIARKVPQPPQNDAAANNSAKIYETQAGGQYYQKITEGDPNGQSDRFIKPTTLYTNSAGALFIEVSRPVNPKPVAVSTEHVEREQKSNHSNGYKRLPDIEAADLDMDDLQPRSPSSKTYGATS